MSNALKIARQLKLPKDCPTGAPLSQRRQQRAGDGAPAKKREEAEHARENAGSPSQRASNGRNLRGRKQNWSGKRAPTPPCAFSPHAEGRRVVDHAFRQAGKIVRVDYKKNIAAVSLGLGYWEVPLDEVFPIPGPV
jgi:hypothetical protein